MHNPGSKIILTKVDLVRFLGPFLEVDDISNNDRELRIEIAKSEILKTLTTIQINRYPITVNFLKRAVSSVVFSPIYKRALLKFLDTLNVENPIRY